MGYQLWTSPVTGYRRRGTRLSDFNTAFGKNITASAIFEPLQSCPADAPADEMRSLLERRDFDVAGVRAAKASPVVGFIRRENLGHGLTKNYVEEIRDDSLVAESATMHDLFAVLKDREYVFVKIEESTSGIITRADLNKPVVRVYFFGLISLLEIHLSFWVAQKYPANSWQSIVGEKRVNKAKETQVERLRRGQSLDLRDCLQFSDKHKLVTQHDELRTDLALGSKNRATRYLKDAENLRNTLAHSQYDLVVGSSWVDLIQLVQEMESTISKSDAQVEAHAAQMATDDIGSLW